MEFLREFRMSVVSCRAILLCHTPGWREGGRERERNGNEGTRKCGKRSQQVCSSLYGGQSQLVVIESIKNLAPQARLYVM
jgi:hypothetical protein